MFRFSKKGTNRIHLISRNKNKNNALIKRIINEFKVEIINEEFDLFEEETIINPNIESFDLYIIAAGYLGNSTYAIMIKKRHLRLLK